MDKKPLSETIHYLTILKNFSSVFQPEIKKAIEDSVFYLCEYDTMIMRLKK